MTNSLLEQAKAAAEKLQDQTKASAGFERKVPVAGKTTARLVGYVELGKQKRPAYKGKEKAPALKARITFELNGSKHKEEYEKDGVKSVFYPTITEEIVVSNSDKSGFYKLMQSMLYGRSDITHMSSMLGEAFIVDITHNESGEGDNKRTYANIYNKSKGAWEIGAPTVTDPISQEVTEVPVPPATRELQMLLWNMPSKEQWESIFIDGTYTKKVDGKEVEVSKNFVQQKCIEATDFPGSALEAMLGGADAIAAQFDVPAQDENTEKAPAKTEAPTIIGGDEPKKEEPVTAVEDTPAQETVSADTAETKTEDAPAEEVDPLAALGL